jgi:hypothetical protein
MEGLSHFLSSIWRRESKLMRVTFDRLLLGARAGASGLVLQLHMVEVILKRTVLEHVEDGLLFNGLKFGFEVLGTFGVRGRVATAAWVVWIVGYVLSFSSWKSPFKWLALTLGRLSVGNQFV